MNGLTILVCTMVALSLLLVTSIVIGTRRQRRDNYSRRVPRVLVLVISSDTNENIFPHERRRWAIEKSYWGTRIDKYRNICSNIDWKLISCNSKKQGDKFLSLDCKESYIPGILQKTMLGISKNLGAYDYFVRTNLSTCIDCRKLMNMISDADHGGTLYTGGRRMTNSGIPYISGTSIVLNAKAASLLVKRYTAEKRMYDKLWAFDDVVIGKILEGESTMLKQYEMYDADTEKSPVENIEVFKGLSTPFFRTKTIIYTEAYSDTNTVNLFELFNDLVSQDLDNSKQ